MPRDTEGLLLSLRQPRGAFASAYFFIQPLLSNQARALL